jgi:2-iminobutanoate/2-iminopropanoate deaminase
MSDMRQVQKSKELYMSRLFYSAIPIVVVALTAAGCAQSPISEMKFIAVSGAPKAAGPYSQGVVSNGMLFTAGFTPRDPVTGVAVQGDMTVQSNRVFDNLEAVLKGAGCSMKDVIKVTVYMTDLNDFAKMNDVMAVRFGDHKPARTTVQVAKLPSAATLEIDFVARIPL